MFRFAFITAACITLLSEAVAADEPFYLGHRAADDLPVLTDEEVGTAQQRAILAALGGDAYGHRGGEHECRGCAMEVRRFAIPSNTNHYGYYRVGGGVPIHGEGPTLEEGVFGWDYFGILFNKRIALNWTHGRRYQGGIEGYKTDGPRHLRR